MPHSRQQIFGLTVTPTTTPVGGLLPLTISRKSRSWICRYGLKSKFEVGIC